MQKMLFNPLTEDFTWVYWDDANEQKIAVMPAHEISYFEPWLAEMMIKHLTDHIINVRGVTGNVEDTKHTIRKEIEVQQ